MPEAGAALGVSVRTAWKLIASGELKAKKIGRRTIVEPAALADYLASVPPAVPETSRGAL